MQSTFFIPPIPSQKRKHQYEIILWFCTLHLLKLHSTGLIYGGRIWSFKCNRASLWMGLPPFNSSTELEFISPWALLPVNEGVWITKKAARASSLPESWGPGLCKFYPSFLKAWTEKGSNREMEKHTQPPHANPSSLLRWSQCICQGKCAQ